MNIILGATGQVGTMIIRELKRNGVAIRAVVRNSDKVVDKTIETRTADLFKAEELTKAFKGGKTVFLLTPENPASRNIIEDTQQIIENYKKAVQATGVKKVVGLSSIGAHLEGNTGNLSMSRMLEQAFDDLDVDKIFIRPSYYFSNWLAYLESAEKFGVLPTFFPGDLKIEMNSPADVAKFLAEVITDATISEHKKIYELAGQRRYSSIDVANSLSKLLDKSVTAQPIPHAKWEETLLATGFTENTATNLINMTQAVIDHKAAPQWPDRVIKFPTSLEDYLQKKA